MSDASDNRPCRHMELPDTLWPRLRTAETDARNLAQDKATLIALIGRLKARIARAEAIVNPKCTCPGACSGPPRKVRAEDIRAALQADISDDYHCDHQWLDRPESDSRECLICGEEAFGA